MANTWIVPTRHMETALEEMPGRVGQPRAAMPFRAPPNSCCIFDRRLWFDTDASSATLLAGKRLDSLLCAGMRPL